MPVPTRADASVAKPDAPRSAAPVPDAPTPGATAAPASATAVAPAPAAPGPGATAPGAASPSPGRPRAWLIATGESLGCLATGLFILLITFGMVLTEFDDQPPTALVLLAGVDLLVGALAALVIGPLRFLSATRVGTVLYLVIATLAGFSTCGLPAGLIALHRLGRKRRTGLDLLAVGLLTGATIGLMALDAAARSASPDFSWMVAVVLTLAVGTTALVLGRLSGTRTALVASLRSQAEAADRERIAADRARTAAEQARESAELARASAERAREAADQARASAEARVRAEERTAIARDMHDSVSHHLAAIAMHAGAMNYREDLPPEQLRRIAGTVRDAAQKANGELRQVLLALRSADGPQPLPTAPALQEIVDDARARGQDVSLTWEGTDSSELDQRGRSTVVALSRMLGEMVTNAAKHSPGEPLTLTLARRQQRLVLTARNPLSDEHPGGDQEGAVPSTGHGLIGLQERARLLGGDARSGCDHDSFEVEAWIPW